MGVGQELTNGVKGVGHVFSFSLKLKIPPPNHPPPDINNDRSLSGGHISISINTLTTSPTIQSESCITETERRWKRIRIEESDSD